MNENNLRVSKIRNGTVIDHIQGGNALAVVKMLGLTGREGTVITIAINVPSERFQKKDILKIEGRELNPEEVDKIALLSPQASINIIRNFNVMEKKRVQLPEVIKEMIQCTNPACISNSNEPVKASFYVITTNPILLKCHYCGHNIEKKDMLNQF